MGSDLAQAFRAKPDSSMRVAVGRVADGQGDAVVSAGNSGAMLAACVFVLGRLPGIERPAIVTVIPTPAGPLVLCGAGANVEPKPEQLARGGRCVGGAAPRGTDAICRLANSLGRVRE